MHRTQTVSPIGPVNRMMTVVYFKFEEVLSRQYGDVNPRYTFGEYVNSNLNLS